MTPSSNAPCGESRTRMHFREPTIPEMLADPIVKAVMAADTVDADMLRAQLSNVARALTKRAETGSGRGRFEFPLPARLAWTCSTPDHT